MKRVVWHGRLADISTITIELAADFAMRLERVRAARRMKASEAISECLARTLPVTAEVTPSALDTLQDIVGCSDSGVPDLATHPRHMEGFGAWRR